MEQVLAVPTPILMEQAQFRNGWSDNTDLRIILDRSIFLDRDLAEHDPRFKQLIPYCVIEAEGHVLAYRRSTKGGESRLYGRSSIGIGGHVNSGDDRDGDNRHTYERAVQRELLEELRCPGTLDAHRFVAGMVNEDKTDVGAVHVGIVHVVRLQRIDELDLCSLAPEIESPGFWPARDIADFDQRLFEMWSRIVIRKLPEII